MTNELTPYLFLGGSWDWQWRAVQGKPVVRYRYQDELYRLLVVAVPHTLSGFPKVFKIYVSAELTDEEARQKLVAAVEDVKQYQQLAARWSPQTYGNLRLIALRRKLKRLIPPGC